jgi:hypothetical protein
MIPMLLDISDNVPRIKVYYSLMLNKIHIQVVEMNRLENDPSYNKDRLFKFTKENLLYTKNNHLPKDTHWSYYDKLYQLNVSNHFPYRNLYESKEEKVS